MTLYIAFNYGGRAEIVNTAAAAAAGGEVSEAAISVNISTPPEMHDPRAGRAHQRRAAQSVELFALAVRLLRAPTSATSCGQIFTRRRTWTWR